MNSNLIALIFSLMHVSFLPDEQCLGYEPLKRLETAFEAAEKVGVSLLLDPEDVIEFAGVCCFKFFCPDESSQFFIPIITLYELRQKVYRDATGDVPTKIWQWKNAKCRKLVSQPAFREEAEPSLF